MRSQRKPTPAPAAEPNPTGLCNRLANIEKRTATLRGAANRLSADMLELSAETAALVEDMRRVGL